MNQPYDILLYYCYTHIEDVEAFREAHHRRCIALGLRGRIIIANEGINGTISGLRAACATYRSDLQADERFVHTHFKVVPHHQHAFQKLHVRAKQEIVHLGLPQLHPEGKAGAYVNPKDLKRLQAQEDVLLLDVRSNVEHELGKFKGAITLDIDRFREFPSQVDALERYKDKTIVTYCTGGVKCEKASAYLRQRGFQNVYQLHGGIIQYGLDTDGADFEGTCYVFDNRLSTPINQINPSMLGKCYVCNEACSRVVNCANPRCNRHTTICRTCTQRLAGACSIVCQQHPEKRAYNGSGYYTKQMNGYDPCKGLRKEQ